MECCQIDLKAAWPTDTPTSLVVGANVARADDINGNDNHASSEPPSTRTSDTVLTNAQGCRCRGPRKSNMVVFWGFGW
jgi:hypothetical protein